MTTITITLPEELAKKAKANGMLSPGFLEECVREKLREKREKNEGAESLTDEKSIEFDPRLAGFVNPELYGKGKINGDIVSPLYAELEEVK